MALLTAFVEAVARHPGLGVFCRSLLEGDFKALRAVIGQELRLDDGIRTLDLGCGPGTFADLFARGDYVGADVDLRCVDHARRTRPGTFIVADARALELPDRRFDQVLIHGLFRHLSEDEVRRVLQESRRVLVSGGRVLVLEEIALLSKRNVIGRVLRRLDGGERLRSRHDYQRVCAEAGRLATDRTVRSGVLDYSATVVTF